MVSRLKSKWCKNQKVTEFALNLQPQTIQIFDKLKVLVPSTKWVLFIVRKTYFSNMKRSHILGMFSSHFVLFIRFLEVSHDLEHVAVLTVILVHGEMCPFGT